MATTDVYPDHDPPPSYNEAVALTRSNYLLANLKLISYLINIVCEHLAELASLACRQCQLSIDPEGGPLSYWGRSCHLIIILII